MITISERMSGFNEELVSESRMLVILDKSRNIESEDLIRFEILGNFASREQIMNPLDRVNNM